MVGVGVRLWNPPHLSGNAEIPMTVVHTTVDDPLTLDGTTIPFKTTTGNIMVRMIGRYAKATRPLPITVKWNNVSFVQKAFFAEPGTGGIFVGLWTLAGQTAATANLVITCGAGNAGVTAIRIGEIGGSPVQVASDAFSGVIYTRAKAPANPLVITGGFVDATLDPLFSLDMDPQWVIKIPAKVDLPNRHDGLAAYFGLTYNNRPDNTYRVRTNATVINTTGACVGIELQLGGTTG